jgi:hypothetical protein
MPVRYSVQSSVVDIAQDTPQLTDSFLVDTNVWFWTTYTKASSIPPPNNPQQYQISDYPDYINKAITAGSKLYSCGLNLSELSHIIERKELEIFQLSHPTIKPKEYRHNFPSERAATVKEIEGSWNLVKNMSEHRDLAINETTCYTLIQMLKGVCIDGYDAFFSIQEQTRNPNFSIITDDGDFSTIPNIFVYTSNKSVINIARKTGKLVVR